MQSCCSLLQFSPPIGVAKCNKKGRLPMVGPTKTLQQGAVFEVSCCRFERLLLQPVAGFVAGLISTRITRNSTSASPGIDHFTNTKRPSSPALLCSARGSRFKHRASSRSSCARRAAAAVARERRLNCVRQRLEHVLLVRRLTCIGLPHKRHLQSKPVFSSKNLLNIDTSACAFCAWTNPLRIST